MPNAQPLGQRAYFDVTSARIALSILSNNVSTNDQFEKFVEALVPSACAFRWALDSSVPITRLFAIQPEH
jgi:hypothetical protein